MVSGTTPMTIVTAPVINATTSMTKQWDKTYDTFDNIYHKWNSIYDK